MKKFEHYFTLPLIEGEVKWARRSAWPPIASNRDLTKAFDRREVYVEGG